MCVCGMGQLICMVTPKTMHNTLAGSLVCKEPAKRMTGLLAYYTPDTDVC